MNRPTPPEATESFALEHVGELSLSLSRLGRYVSDLEAYAEHLEARLQAAGAEHEAEAEPADRPGP